MATPPPAPIFRPSHDEWKDFAAYVRQITFNGNEKTNDETLRREMRQFEGAPFSRRGVERSRTRLARLPYIQDVQVNTEKVAGSEDLVDVDYDVTERAAGTLQFGVGFSSGNLRP